jgi:hypothetical protein
MHITCTSLHARLSLSCDQPRKPVAEETCFGNYNLEFCPFCAPAFTLLSPGTHGFMPTDTQRLTGIYGNIWGLRAKKRRLKSRKDLQPRLEVARCKKATDTK